MHELAMSSDHDPINPLPTAAYITLTYSDENLPENYQLDIKHWQVFAKALRHRVGPFRFLMCGEYGEATEENKWIARPHFHAIIYGHDFVYRGTKLERIFYKKNEQGHSLFTSPLLEVVWKKGFNVIGDVTFDSVSYVAGYIQKKVNGRDAKAHYRKINYATGKVYDQVPEFGNMSRNKGLGNSWIEKNYREVYPFDEVIVNGVKASPPDYYDRWYAENHPREWEEVKKKRQSKTHQYEKDNSPERLAAKKKCFTSKHNHYR